VFERLIWGRSWAILILLSCGANPNTRDSRNRTALDLLLAQSRSTENLTFLSARYLELAAEHPFPPAPGAAALLRRAFDPPTPRTTFVDVLAVDRVEYSSLDTLAFYRSHSRNRRPVVLENSLAAFNMSTWTPRTVGEACSAHPFQLHAYNPSESTWALLKSAPNQTSTVLAFVNHWLWLSVTPSAPRDMSRQEQHAQLRIFDQSFAQHCGNLGRLFTVPRIFSIDFRRNWDFAEHDTHGSIFNVVHPSIFVDPQGAKSGLHIDSGETSFWMVVLSGRKHFRFVSPDALHFLKDVSRDEAYTSFRFDLFEPDFVHWPAATNLTVHDAIVGPGDTIYVPAGTPHQVVTLENTVAFSSNFIEPEGAARALKFCCLDTSEQHSECIASLAPLAAVLSSSSCAQLDALVAEYVGELQRQARTDLGLNHSEAQHEQVDIPLWLYFEQRTIAERIFGIKPIPLRDQNSGNRQGARTAASRDLCASAGFP
jgi:hypothetical protein